MEKPHIFKSRDARLSAVWHESRTRQSPLVIFLHGFGRTKVEAHRMFVKCARQLAEKEIPSLRFDFYGAGDSDGSLTDATFSIWIENVLAAVSFAKSKHKKKVILLGFSLGAFVAAAVAPRVSASGLTLWAPIFHPLKRILREKTLMTQARRDGFADYQGELVKYSLVEDAARFKIPKIFEGYVGPVCIIHGSNDESALAIESRQYARFYRTHGAQVELHTINHANHTFDRHDWETEVIERTVLWIVSRSVEI